MSRSIEFRAWADYGNGYGEMLPNIQNHINGDWAFGNILMNNVEGTNFTVEQFTGLLDCNGVKIFEGDIVEVDSESQCSTHAVEWCDNDYPAFDLYPRIDCESNGLSFALNALGISIMVIGNIHQNSELLK